MRTQVERQSAEAEKVVRDIRGAARRQYSAEEKMRIVIAGLRGEENIAELCRKECINQNRSLMGGTSGVERVPVKRYPTCFRKCPSCALFVRFRAFASPDPAAKKRVSVGPNTLAGASDRADRMWSAAEIDKRIGIEGQGRRRGLLSVKARFRRQLGRENPGAATRGASVRGRAVLDESRRGR